MSQTSTIEPSAAVPWIRARCRNDEPSGRGKEARMMRRREREAVVAALDDKLFECGSWCGETHLQKSLYFLQELLDVPTGFEYTLYKYGPFSSPLRGELGAMRSDGLLVLEAPA